LNNISYRSFDVLYKTMYGGRGGREEAVAGVALIVLQENGFHLLLKL